MTDVADVSAPEISDQSNADVSAPETVETAPSNRHKLVVDGEEMELDLEELKKGYQKARSSDKRFQEAAQQAKQIKELMDLAKTNPDLLFEHLGLDPVRYSEDKLLKKLEWETMSPEQQELHQMKQELAKYKQTESEKAEVAKKAAYEQEVAQVAEQLDLEIFQAVEAAQLPKNGRTIARIADYMIAGKTAKAAAEQTYKDFNSDIEELLGALDEDTLYQRLPKSVLAKIRKADTKAAKVPAKPASQIAPTEKQGSKPKSLDDWFKSLPKGE